MTISTERTGSAPEPAELARSLRRADCGEVATDPGRLAQYSADASNYRQVPRAVLFPRTRQQVINSVAACRELGLPVTCRGAGTSTSGQAVGSGVVLDFSRFYNRLLDLDPSARQATVEPGIVLDDLQAAAAPHGLLFGPDPSTHSRCTIGGMIGNNACGSHSFAWGRTAENVVELEVVTYRGTVMTVGEMTREEIDQAIAEGGERGALIGRLHELAQADLELLRTRLGRFPRQVSGYALEQLLPENRFNLARALVGAEGTCAVVLSAKLRLVLAPQDRSLVVFGFTDACEAADAVPDLLRQPRLVALECVDQALTDIVTRPQTRATIETLPTGRAWLFAELAGPTGELPAAGAELVATARSAKGFTDAEIVADPRRAKSLWRIREDGVGLATRLPDGSQAWPGWEDAAVPPARLGAYLRELRSLFERHGLSGAVYGHFGEGCLHTRINFDFTTEHGVGVFRAFLTDAATLVTAHGGSLSGEHGDGQARSELLPMMYGPQVMRMFEHFKHVWDPDNGLNPGMIVHPLPLDGNLRVTPHRPALPLVTRLPFHADGGDFAKATRRCVGVGKCRSATPQGGVMCPSYRVTRDEKDSTRGRARLLYEMTQGDVITDGWRSTDVRDALDLCLSCKGCSVDCPVGVDVASYKSEFLYHHYRRRFRPASHYSMGWLPLLSRIAARMPKAVNAVTSSRLAPLIKRAGGIAAERELPRFADRTFLSWFRARAPSGTGERGRVTLWVELLADRTPGWDPRGSRSPPSPRPTAISTPPPDSTRTPHCSPRSGWTTRSSTPDVADWPETSASRRATTRCRGRAASRCCSPPSAKRHRTPSSSPTASAAAPRSTRRPTEPASTSPSSSPGPCPTAPPRCLSPPHRYERRAGHRRSRFRAYQARLAVRLGEPDDAITTLSGGNDDPARWFSR
ncbi:FAD-linked oxidase C-terminal domain-containing protein [Acrocarpospora catenulata]|uniref:FAD-linked oxidase C-terminal domain-containing protein n=1 Tax=Acrocarpospora catenulata TaxID=2836182 RepID=UPI0027DFC90F|nr:FAD-linked oxidase C-terminal domain-containing protein [Acrocarpospora catenulata]